MRLISLFIFLVLFGCNSENVIKSTRGDKETDAGSYEVTCATTNLTGTSKTVPVPKGPPGSPPQKCTPPSNPKPPANPKPPGSCCNILSNSLVTIIGGIVGVNGSCSAQLANFMSQCIYTGGTAGMCEGTVDPSAIASCLLSFPTSAGGKACLGIPLPTPAQIAVAIASASISIGAQAAECGLDSWTQRRFGSGSVQHNGLQTTCVEKGMWPGGIFSSGPSSRTDQQKLAICASCCRDPKQNGGIKDVSACLENCVCAFTPKDPACRWRNTFDPNDATIQ